MSDLRNEWRRARKSDGAEMARLAAELGYPQSVAEMTRRLTVRSNAARELSHPFYEALGYSRDKTQHVYRKTIEPRCA